MSRHSAILEAVRASGHRLTPQRVLIITIVAEKKGHIGSGEIYEKVKQAYPFGERGAQVELASTSVKGRKAKDGRSGVQGATGRIASPL